MTLEKKKNEKIQTHYIRNEKTLDKSIENDEIISLVQIIDVSNANFDLFGGCVYFYKHMIHGGIHVRTVAV